MQAPKASIGKPFIVKGTRAKYSPAQLASAWKYSTDLAAKYSYNPAMMDTTNKQVTPKLLQPLRAEMTKVALADFDKAAAGYARDGSKDPLGILGLALVGWHEKGWTLPSTPVTGLVINGTMSTSNDGKSLAVKLTQRTQVHAINPKGEPVKTTLSKTVTTYLLPQADSWVIDGWWSQYNSGDVTPDS